jgi:hypothetical protein
VKSNLLPEYNFDEYNRPDEGEESWFLPIQKVGSNRPFVCR